MDWSFTIVLQSNESDLAFTELYPMILVILFEIRVLSSLRDSSSKDLNKIVIDSSFISSLKI